MTEKPRFNRKWKYQFWVVLLLALFLLMLPSCNTTGIIFSTANVTPLKTLEKTSTTQHTTTANTTTTQITADITTANITTTQPTTNAVTSNTTTADTSSNLYITLTPQDIASQNLTSNIPTENNTSPEHPTTSTNATPAISPAAIVKSSDKTLTLNIPAGALPESVNASSIRITRLANKDPYIPTVNDQAVLACYFMEPNGLQFNTPVSVNVTLPFTGSTTPMPLLFSEIYGVSLLDEVKVIPTKSSGAVTILGKINHFSDLIISKKGPFTLSLSIPSSILAGHSFDVNAIITNNPDFRNMVVKKKGKDSENSVTYWVSFVSYTCDCYLSEQGTVNHLSPHDISVPGAKMTLDTQGRTQTVPIAANFYADAPSNAVALNYRLVMELTTEARSDKYGNQKLKTCIYEPEITTNFVINKPYVNGRYLVHTSIISDPSNYAHNIQLSTALTCVITVSGSKITIEGNGNWVKVKGQIQTDGKFTASGTGMVGDRLGESVEIKGSFTEYMVFQAEYAMGTGGVRVIYDVTGTGLGLPSRIPVINKGPFVSGGFLLFYGNVVRIRNDNLLQPLYLSITFR
jgi:hypothetical protein